jgi:Tfp pilus assembly protein PilP
VTAPQHVTVKPSSGGKVPAAKQSAPDELSRYNSEVKLDLLNQLEDRPLPELARDPFEFVGSAPAKATPVGTPAPAPAAAAEPPPPPPVSLKPMGYSEGKGGVKEAMVSDEDQVFVVHEGDSVGTRYKVIKITATTITVEDATIHQTVDLPIPQ